jgi:hypothetical protein
MDVAELSGLYVGQLDQDELQAFERAVSDGLAFRSYNGPSGMMGVAKVAIKTVVRANM